MTDLLIGFININDINSFIYYIEEYINKVDILKIIDSISYIDNTYIKNIYLKYTFNAFKYLIHNDYINFTIFNEYLINEENNNLYEFKWIVDIIKTTNTRYNYDISNLIIKQRYSAYDNNFIKKVEYFLKNNRNFNYINSNESYKSIENLDTYKQFPYISNYILKKIKKQEIQLIKLLINYKVIDVNLSLINYFNHKKNKKFLSFLINNSINCLNEIELSSLLVQYCKLHNYPMIRLMIKRIKDNNVIKTHLLHNLCNYNNIFKQQSKINEWINCIIYCIDYYKDILRIDEDLADILFNNKYSILIFGIILEKIKLDCILSEYKITEFLDTNYNLIVSFNNTNKCDLIRKSITKLIELYNSSTMNNIENLTYYFDVCL